MFIPVELGFVVVRFRSVRCPVVENVPKSQGRIGYGSAGGRAGQAVEGYLGGGPFRVRLAVARSLAQDHLSHQDLDGEDGFVVWSLGGNEAVEGSGLSPALDQLLQLGLGIIHRPAPLGNFHQVRRQGLTHESAGDIVALVQIDCRHHSLECLLQEGFPVVAARFHLSLAQYQMFAQGNAPCGVGQACPAHQ